ncbi:MAG: glutaredoxin domain-containing protein [Acidobacteriota bacterium]
MRASPFKQATSLWTLLVTVALVWGLFQGLQWWQARRQSQALAEVLQQSPVRPGEVLMYTTSTCPYCAQAREWLSQHKVPFTDCNIELEAHCQAEFEQQGSPGVPLMKVRGLWNLGFDAQWVTLALQRPSQASRSANQPADSPSTAKSPRP